MVILVTGAGGKTGRAVIEALAAKGKRVRAFARRDEHEVPAREAGASDVVMGDMLIEADVRQAMQDAETVYHIAPNVHPDEVALARIAITAATEAGVGRFVYHSVLHPQVEAMPHHWLKMRVEELLFTSGLAFTILQPAAYMQNVLVQATNVTKQGTFEVPYPVATRMSLVDLADAAEAAATVLSEDGHEYAIYELAGPEALSQDALAAQWGTALGREVVAHEISLDKWEQNARSAGLPEFAIETLLAMFRYYAEHGFVGNPNVLRWLLEREPTTFSAFIAREIPIED